MNDIVQLIITHTGCSISAIALLISIIISKKLDLANLISGNNLENLLGILLHYLWLVAFAFMSIFAVYLCKTLTKLVAHNGDGIVSKTKYIFNILGLILQLMFLLPLVLLDFVRVRYFSAKYSGSMCFPTGYVSNPVFVSVPLPCRLFLIQ